MFIKVKDIDFDNNVVYVNVTKNRKPLIVPLNQTTMFEMFTAWKEQAQKLKNGEISKEEYDAWRYNYPEK